MEEEEGTRAVDDGMGGASAPSTSKKKRRVRAIQMMIDLEILGAHACCINRWAHYCQFLFKTGTDEGTLVPVSSQNRH